MYAMAEASGMESSNSNNNSNSCSGVTMEGVTLEHDDRAAIYTTLLHHMTDEQRIAVTVRAQLTELSSFGIHKCR
jgi:hypothetical protein